MRAFLINLFLTLWLGLLTAAAIQSHRPADWSKVQGLDPVGKGGVPNLMERMEQTVFRRNAPMEISEADINHYLAREITGTQNGLSKSKVKFDTLALHFEKDLCQACFSWRSGNSKPITASLNFTVSRKGENFVIEPQSGTYGRLPVYRGFFCTLTPALTSLCDALNNEIHTVFEMNQIRFEKNKLVLDPRSESAK
ncbi:MAG: hypothetical protein RL693_2397 [Verrucomicrobiota bacterium]